MAPLSESLNDSVTVEYILEQTHKRLCLFVLLLYVPCYEITSKKRLLLWFFFLGKLANVSLRNFYYNALGAFFDALIQRPDGCTEFLWLLMQTHHIIRCSHKRCKNRLFNQHMIFRCCIEGSGEPVQTCILARAFVASTRDLDISYIVQ